MSEGVAPARAHSASAKLGLAVVVLCLSVVCRIARARLSGVENPTMAAWPGQLIFGFYFAVLVLAVQRLQAILRESATGYRPQVLLLLVLIGLCLDLVLVNLQEITGHTDASYGLVVLWDTTTFFLWLRAIELCAPRTESRFRTSWAVSIAPVLKLGREVLFLPYSPRTPGPGRAYLDLVFGDLLVCMWVLFSLAARPPAHSSSQTNRGQRLLELAVLTGSGYWFLNAVENVLSLAWSPLPGLVYGTLQRRGMSPQVLSYAYFMIALGGALVARRWGRLRVARSR